MMQIDNFILAFQIDSIFLNVSIIKPSSVSKEWERYSLESKKESEQKLRKVKILCRIGHR